MLLSQMHKVWFAPMKLKNWYISKENNVFGVAIGRSNLLDKVSVGDFLAFYVFPPIHGMIGLANIISDPYQSSHDYYGGNKYRYIIDLKFDGKYSLDKNNVIPLYKLFGYND